MRTLTIPAPAPWISANDRPHWREKARRTSAWRAVTRLAARTDSHDPLVTPGAITIAVHRASARKADATNLAPTAKACIDGLVDAGWLPDDDDQHVIATTLTITEQGDPT